METWKRFGVSRLLEIAGAKKIYLIISAILAVISLACSLVPYIIIYLVMIKILDPHFGPDDYSYILELAFAGVGIVFLRYLIMFASIMFSHVAALKLFTVLESPLPDI